MDATYRQAILFFHNTWVWQDETNIARDRLIKEKDAEGNITKYEYNEVDNLTAIIDPENNRTEYEYDELDREITRINAYNDKFITEYDLVSNVIQTTDELERKTYLFYDNRDL